MDSSSGISTGLDHGVETVTAMATATQYDALEMRNIKALVLALEDFDDSIIGMVRDLVLAPKSVNVAISEDTLKQIEDARQIYLQSNFEFDSMILYLETINNFIIRKLWISLTRALMKAYTSEPTTALGWQFALQSVQVTGDRAWKAAVPASKTLATHGGGADTINGIINKFRIIDDFIDLTNLNSTTAEPKWRMSEELNDTLQAIIQITSMGGQYVPLTNANINAIKNLIRQERQKQKLESQLPEAHTSNVDLAPAEPTQPLPVDAPAIKADHLPDNLFPLLITIVSTFTLLAAIFGSFAWKYSPHDRGTTTDADFWFLIQSNCVSLPGLAAIVIPLLRTEVSAGKSLPKNARRAIWFAVTVSFCCVVGSIPTYLYIPTEYACTMAFFGSAMQGTVILLLMVQT